jgi:N-acyl-D-aspartate/D-glutamate deacylase
MPMTIPERRAAYADMAWRERVREGWRNGDGLLPRWDSYEIMEAPHSPATVGRRLNDLAREANADPFDALLELALAEPDLKLRVKAMLANDDAEGVAMLLNTDGCTLGLSDAGAHVGQLCDAVLPTDLLGAWVRERKVLSLEQAVHKLTQVQADLFRFEDRGVLRAGAFADVVIFDAGTIAPGPVRRVWDFPANGERLTADQPSGIHGVFVNGRQVVAEGNLMPGVLEDRPGVLVTPGLR